MPHSIVTIRGLYSSSSFSSVRRPRCPPASSIADFNPLSLVYARERSTSVRHSHHPSVLSFLSRCIHSRIALSSEVLPLPLRGQVEYGLAIVIAPPTWITTPSWPASRSATFFIGP